MWNKQVQYGHTPVDKDGLTQYDHLPSDLAAARAWDRPGNNPQWHEAMKKEVRGRMPVLARALDRLVEERG